MLNMLTGKQTTGQSNKQLELGPKVRLSAAIVPRSVDIDNQLVPRPIFWCQLNSSLVPVDHKLASEKLAYIWRLKIIGYISSNNAN